MESKQRADKACENTTSFFGLLGSEPNYILAADEYTKAGNSFRGSKAYGQAVECFIKAGECHQKLDSFFLAAKSYETAALVLEKNMDQFERASSIYKKASMFYVPGGSPDKAGEILEKSAKVMESVDAIKAADIYVEACQLYVNEDRFRFGVDTFKRALTFCLRSRQIEYSKIISDKLEDGFFSIQNISSFQRQVLSSVIINLSVMNEKAALEKWNQGCSKVPQLSESNEGQAILTLLQAFETCSKELLDSVLKMGEVQYLDVEVAKLARGLTLPATPQNVQSAPDQLDGFHSHADLQEEIEEEGYL
ncbi:soluble NSF attachment protein [Globomyces pollinis-pini]|nr:soluble NSF attachment protein [Globomyces pollinis-pini]